MNQATALANAKASELYPQGIVSYYQPTFNSIFQIDKTLSTSTCQEQVESYNVVFVLHNATGSVVANLVITESQNLTVLGSSIQDDHPTNTYTANNAGYEVYYTGGSTNYIYGSWTDYTQPTPQYPSNPSTCANGGACYVNSWTGIGDAAYNSGARLGQAGSSAWCNVSTCTDSSGRGYFAWYEIVAPSPNNIYVVCDANHGGAVTIHGGDSMYTYTLNNYYNGGSNTQYTFLIQDTTTNTSCYVNNVADGGYATNPTYAYYITEIPYNCNGGSLCTLAKFGTVSFSSATYNDWNTQQNYGMNAAYSAGHYVQDYMENGVLNLGSCTNAVQNIISSAPTTGGNFGNQWSTSANTPGGCQP